MKKTRFTEAQIMGVLRQVEGGVPAAKLCRAHGMSSATLRSAQGGARKKVIRPANCRALAEKAVATRGVSIALACRAFVVSETCFRYSPKLDDENEQIADLFLGLTTAKKTWGFGLCFLCLRNVQGHGWNHKRVYRIYRELGLNLRSSRDIPAGCPAG